MKLNIDYTLYLVTDRELMAAKTIETCVEQAIMGGCTVVQLREKNASSREFYDIAVCLRELTARCNVPLIINDRADIAMAVGADGIHIGQTDMPYHAVRRIAGQDMVIGVSVSTVAEALEAAAMGADYLGVGAMFVTGTKIEARLTGMEELHRIRQHITIPIVVIGGINKTTAPLFNETGVDGIAVVSAIVSHNDPAAAARELRVLFKGRT